MVALRKESVDRNAEKMKVGGIDVSSLSARRAWIEMLVLRFLPLVCLVALRKESVDRNGYLYVIEPTAKRSLSARRAWIEIDDRL